MGVSTAPSAVKHSLYLHQGRNSGTSLAIKCKIIESAVCPDLGWIQKLVVCTECGHVANNEERHKEHFQELRHINHFRDMAYRDPKKKQLWLKVWLNSIDEQTEEDYFDEEEEEVGGHEDTGKMVQCC